MRPRRWAPAPRATSSASSASLRSAEQLVTALLFINPRAGDERPSADELVAAAAERGIETRLLDGGHDVRVLAHSAAVDALGVAGGDGSLAAVAQVAADRDLPFVCIPFGTRNHFARDLGLDRNDPIGCLDAFSGEERRIDLGRAGDRVFLNNVSLGLYAALVHRREHRRRRREALARARALSLSLRDRHPAPFTIDGELVRARVLLVANNPYSLKLFDVGAREVLDSGSLHVYAACGWLPNTWEDYAGTRFTVDSALRPLRAAVDGEPEVLEGPVEFTVEPRALRVLVPRGGG